MSAGVCPRIPHTTLPCRSQERARRFFSFLVLSLTGRKSGSGADSSGTPGSGNGFSDSVCSAATSPYAPHAPIPAGPSPLPGQVTRQERQTVCSSKEMTTAPEPAETPAIFSSLPTSSPLSPPSPQKPSFWCEDQSGVAAGLLSEPFSTGQTA